MSKRKFDEHYDHWVSVSEGFVWLSANLYNARQAQELYLHDVGEKLPIQFLELAWVKWGFGDGDGFTEDLNLDGTPVAMWYGMANGYRSGAQPAWQVSTYAIERVKKYKAKQLEESPPQSNK